MLKDQFVSKLLEIQAEALNYYNKLYNIINVGICYSGTPYPSNPIRAPPVPHSYPTRAPPVLHPYPRTTVPSEIKLEPCLYGLI